MRHKTSWDFKKALDGFNSPKKTSYVFKTNNFMKSDNIVKTNYSGNLIFHPVKCIKCTTLLPPFFD